jgi:hypothetical protein
VQLLQDREQLVAALRTRGVDYLAPRDAMGAPVDDETLVASLAAHEDARLRQALIALLMLQPQLGPIVRQLHRQVAPQVETELVAAYMAAVYLRQIWAIRLEHYRPGLAPLPDYFSELLQLPSPDADHGEVGLRALAAWHQQLTDRPGNRLAEYENVAELLIRRLQLRAHRDVAAAASRAE